MRIFTFNGRISSENEPYSATYFTNILRYWHVVATEILLSTYVVGTETSEAGGYGSGNGQTPAHRLCRGGLHKVKRAPETSWLRQRGTWQYCG